MKKKNLLLLGAIITCVPALLSGCEKSKNTVEIKNDIEKTHYLKFIENNSEILRMVVLKTDTYETLLPYFPTLTEEEGYIKYWDGNYQYTTYTHENQFKVYDEDDLIIDIYAYSKKID